MTDAFWNNLVNCPSGEAWICIWPENMGTRQFVEGIDINALKADYEELTNRPFPGAAVPGNGCAAFLAQLFGAK